MSSHVTKERCKHIPVVNFNFLRGGLGIIFIIRSSNLYLDIHVAVIIMFQITDFLLPT